MKASARKSYDAYKPLIVHDNGRTEIVGKRSKSSYWERVAGRERFCRGVTFADRADAVAYAQRHIERLIADRERRAKERDERHAKYAAQAAS